MIANACPQQCKSELEPARKLQPSHGGSVLRGNNVGDESGTGPAIHAAAWIVEVRVIEEIERLHSRLEVQSLGQIERLGKCQICVDQARTEERVSFDVSKSSREWPDVRSRYLTCSSKRGNRSEVGFAMPDGIEPLLPQRCPGSSRDRHWDGTAIRPGRRYPDLPRTGCRRG